MAVNFKFDFCLSDKEKRNAVKMRRLKIVVHWGDDFQHKNDFFVCINCGSILLPSGFYDHRRKNPISDVVASRRVSLYARNLPGLIELVKRELERRIENGRLRGWSSIRDTDGTIPFINIPLHPCPRRSLPHVHRPRRPLVPVPDERPPSVFHPVEQVHENDVFGPDDDLPDCADILSCLSKEGFDASCFSRFAEDFLRKLSEKNETEDRIEKAKATIVSVLAQNLYVMCCLTKDQMKNITAFWKAMMVFISPQTASTSKRIRASYNTCLREAERRYDAGLERQLKCSTSVRIFPSLWTRHNLVRIISCPAWGGLVSRKKFARKF